MQSLKIAFVTSEVAPLAKTGGLADVSAALPRELHDAGHDVKVFLPLYARIEESGQAGEPVEGLQNLSLMLGKNRVIYSVRATKLPGSDLTIHVIECPGLYRRPNLYTQDADEHLRFLLLTRAAIEVCQRLQWAPDVFHFNDWQTALGPLYLKSVYAWDKLFHATRSLLTIHNLGYQGVFGAAVVPELGLGDAAHLLHQEDLKAGRIGFLKHGIIYADGLSTVSPTYAREIQTEQFGMHLHEVLRRRADSLTGILNGVDTREWNPRTDTLITQKYSAKSLYRKEKNKQALIEELGLPYRKEVPVAGIVSRLTGQKGFELVAGAMPGLLGSRELQLVVLGTGESRYEEFFTSLQRRFPNQVCFFRGYSNELAHRIEAGADLFVMPSLYEPCGLNQMYSLAYGTIPVVRKTGGLADTVEPYDPTQGTGTGFVFEHFTAEGLRWALEQALDTYTDRKAWKNLMQAGMAQDFSWTRQTEVYVELYRRLAPARVQA